MRTADPLRIEFRRLLDEDRLEEAEALLDRIEPLSDEEWLKWLNDAPVDDEPLTAKEIERLDAAALRRAAELSAKLRVGRDGPFSGIRAPLKTSLRSIETIRGRCAESCSR